MASYVAMLRGINVGGRATVAMADLRTLFTDLGYGDVRTYIQSGNVVFRTPGRAAVLSTAIEERLEGSLGLPLKVVLRTNAQLVKALDRNPLAGGGRDSAKLHISFLAGAPTSARARAIDPGAYLPDEFRIVGREVYVHCPDGYGRTKLNNGFFERALDVVATTRNLQTVAELTRLSS